MNKVLLWSTVIVAILAIKGQTQEATRPPANLGLYFQIDSAANLLLDSTFGQQVRIGLAEALKDIGYSLFNADSARFCSDTVICKDRLVLRLTVSAISEERREFTVGVVRADDFSEEHMMQALGHPLVSMACSPADQQMMQSVLIKKVVENLRTQYFCYLSIDTDRVGALIQTNSGLSEYAPVRWVLPVGVCLTTITAKGFLPYKKAIELSRPGEYHYLVQLRKRQLYHSVYFIPSMILAAGAAGSLVMERIRYTRYQDLGETDLHNTPDIFGKAYEKAQQWEYATAILAGCAIAGLSLSVWF